MVNGDGTLVTKSTCWKKIKVFLGCTCGLIVLGIVGLVVRGIIQNNCSIDSLRSTYDASKQGPNGWSLFIANNVNSMQGPKVSIRVEAVSAGDGIFSDSPTTVSYDNGIVVTKGSSTSYGTYSSNVSLVLFAPGSVSVNVAASVLLWCSDCSLHGPEGKCPQDIQSEWVIYRVSFTVPNSEVNINVSPRSGTIRLQGVFV